MAHSTVTFYNKELRTIHTVVSGSTTVPKRPPRTTKSKWGPGGKGGKWSKIKGGNPV
jgi:hypothetical protein